MPLSTMKLKKARGKMSQSEAAFAIASQLGSVVYKQQVFCWENGVVPSANRLEAIALAYNVTMASLFEGSKK